MEMGRRRAPAKTGRCGGLGRYDPEAQFDKAILVYQLDDDASVLRVCEFSSSPESDRPGLGRGAHTLMQACANKCEMFTQGLAAAVVEIRVAVCQRSGDVAEARGSVASTRRPTATWPKPRLIGKHARQ